MSLSPETLTFLSELLKQVTVSAADPNFEQAASTVARARKELDATIAAGSSSAARRKTTGL